MGKKKQVVVNPVWERKKNAIMRNYRKTVNVKNPKVPQSSIDNEMDATAEHLEPDIQEKKGHHDKTFLKIGIPKRSVNGSIRSKNVDEQQNIIIASSKVKRMSVASKEKITIQNKSKSYLSMREKANTRTRAKLIEDQKLAKREMDNQHYYEEKGFGVIKNISKSERVKKNQRGASKKYKERKALMSQLLNNSSSIYETNISSQCSTTTIPAHSDQSFSNGYNNPITSRNYGDLSFSTGTSSLSIHREHAIKTVETIKNKSNSDLLMREKANASIYNYRAKLTEDRTPAKREMDRQCYYEKKVCVAIKSISCKSEKDKMNKRKKWREASRKYRERKKLSQTSNNLSPTYETNFLTSCSTTTISTHIDSSVDQFSCNGSLSSRNSSASAFSPKSPVLSLRREQGIKRVKTIKENVYRQLVKQKHINEELKRKLDKYKRLISLQDSKIIELLADSL